MIADERDRVCQRQAILTLRIIITPGVHGGLDDDVLQRRIRNCQPHKVTHFMVIDVTGQCHYRVHPDAVGLAIIQSPTLDLEQVFAAAQTRISVVFEAVKLQVDKNLVLGVPVHAIRQAFGKGWLRQLDAIGIDTDLVESTLKQQVDHCKQTGMNRRFAAG